MCGGLAVVALGFAYSGLYGYEPYAGTGFEDYADDVEAFFFEPSGNPPWLLALLAFMLVFDRRYRIRRAWGQPASLAAAVPLLSGAVGFHLWASYVSAQDLLVVSLILLVLGAGALLGGRAGVRALRLPAAFLLLLLPLPTELMNSFVFALQLAAASIATWVLGLLGMPAFQLGDQVFTRYGIFHVIETCSGLRLIQTLTMAAVVYAEVFHRNARLMGLLVLAAPAIGFFVNQLRVLSIVLNPYSDLSAVHTAQGVGMVVVGVLLIAALDAALRRAFPKSLAGRPSSRFPARPRGDATARVVGLLALLLALGLARLLLEPWQLDEPPPRPSVSRLPTTLSGWKVAAGLPRGEDFLGTVVFSQWLHRRYEQGDESVDIFVGSDRHLRRRASLLSPKTAYPGAGWMLLDRRRVEPLPGGPLVEELEFRSANERRLVWHWRSGVESLATEVARSTLALDQSPLRRPGRALVYRLSTPVEAGASQHEAARERLRTLAPAVRSFYEPAAAASAGD